MVFLFCWRFICINTFEQHCSLLASFSKPFKLKTTLNKISLTLLFITLFQSESSCSNAKSILKFMNMHAVLLICAFLQYVSCIIKVLLNYDILLMVLNIKLSYCFFFLMLFLFGHCSNAWSSLSLSTLVRCLCRIKVRLDSSVSFTGFVIFSLLYVLTRWCPPV